MIKNRVRFLAIMSIGFVLSLVAMPVALADFAEGDWHFVKEIVLPSGLSEEGLVEIIPDEEVFAEASSGLVDLRIISGSDVETAYIHEISKGESSSEVISASVRERGYIPGEYDTFVVDIGREGSLHNRIEIVTSSVNFRRDVLVESSSDADTWAEVAEQSIYDFTLTERGVSTRDTLVRYPETTSRYLRVRIMDDGEGSLATTGARMFIAREVPPREVEWPAAISFVYEDSENNATVVDIDMGRNGLPSHILSLKVSDVNFYRTVSLDASADGENWRRLVSNAAIYSYDTPKFVGGNLVITYPETRTRFFRLIVRNEDNPPILFEDVEVKGLGRRIVFMAEPGESYQLYYGNAEARRPSYDLAHIFPYLETENLPLAVLGPQVETQPLPSLTPTTPVSEELPWLMPVVVVGATLVVGLILFGVLRQIKGLLPPPPE